MAQPTVGTQASRLTKYFKLVGSSTTIPKLVYGTAWKKEQSEDLTYKALKNGFRGVDTAPQSEHYDEKGVGLGVQRAVKDGLVKREDLFIQTKFSSAYRGSNLPYDPEASLEDKVHQSISSSLKRFTIEGQEAYFDSLVMHSPLETDEKTLQVWNILESFVPHKIRNLGISNITFDSFRLLYERSTVKPSIVQNRFYADTGYETQLRSFCRQRGIVFQSFFTLTANMPLARSRPVKDVAMLASVSQAAAHYSLVIGLEGITVLNGTTNEAHMREDLEGLEKVGEWAEGRGAEAWASALVEFRRLIGESDVDG